MASRYPDDNVAGAELFGQGQDEAADHRTGDVAEPAEDHDRERLDGGEIAHLREHDIDRAEQRAGRGGKARTDGKGRVCRSGSTLTPISDGGVRILKGRAHRACRAWCG